MGMHIVLLHYKKAMHIVLLHYKVGLRVVGILFYSTISNRNHAQIALDYCPPYFNHHMALTVFLSLHLLFRERTMQAYMKHDGLMGV